MPRLRGSTCPENISQVRKHGFFPTRWPFAVIPCGCPFSDVSRKGNSSFSFVDWRALMQSVYLREYRHVARQAFSMWNREPASPSAGSFDRRYWGWKSKDFGDSTMQYAVRLAIAYAEELGLTSTLPCLLEQYVDHMALLQHRD